MGHWTPEIADGPAPLYLRLARAIEADIGGMRLKPGDKLPTHRELAQALSISPGTIAKAYQEVESHGLLDSHVGRGSFVLSGATATTPRRAGMVYNLARNIPPSHVADDVIRNTLHALWARGDVGDMLNHLDLRGALSVRQSAARWIARHHGIQGVDARDMIQTNGSTHALSVILAALYPAGATILTEAATFNGIKLIARAQQYSLAGIAGDSEGILPDSLREQARRTGAKVLYLIPTLQNPTTTSMSSRRRQQIVEVCRELDLLIIEDDIYRSLANERQRPPTLWEMARDRVFYIASLSKTLCHGLRLGFVLPPDNRHADMLLSRMATFGYAPPALGAFVFDQWVKDGTAEQISADIAAEATQRLALARRILGNALAEPGEKISLHAWLPLPPLETERVAGRALRAGVQLTPTDAQIVDDRLVSGLRLCLGAVSDMASLDAALTIVARCLVSEMDDAADPIF